MKKSLLNIALKIARDKICNHPQLEHWIHYSFIIQNNAIIEWATNLSFDPPIHYGYKNRIDDVKYRPKLHSEIVCYKRAKGLLIKNKFFEIINIRLNKQGEVRLSKPCPCCYEIMKELGCSKFYYSTNQLFMVA